MGQTTGIGWTDHTFNFWWGCTKVSAECDRCYIENIMQRAGIKEPFSGPIRTKNWQAPLAWNRAARRDGVRRRVFTCSMSDFFHAGANDWRAEAWQVIRTCESLDWLILTKRSTQIRHGLPDDWGLGYRNVWLGVTCGCAQSRYRVAELVQIPTAIRFVSAEPLLETVYLRPYLSQLDWVITGCEQAAKAKRRPLDLDWVRDLDRQCQEARVAHFFKQYYRDDRGVPCTDGLLDGLCRQAWPAASAVCDSRRARALASQADNLRNHGPIGVGVAAASGPPPDRLAETAGDEHGT